MGAELGEAGVPARDMVDALEGVRSILLKPSERLDDKRFTRMANSLARTRIPRKLRSN
jgi:deoxyhypusine synthase